MANTWPNTNTFMLTDFNKAIQMLQNRQAPWCVTTKGSVVPRPNLQHTAMQLIPSKKPKGGKVKLPKPFGFVTQPLLGEVETGST